MTPGRPAAGDALAHRRGEPRLFTLAWMLFLLGALLTTVLAARPRGTVEVSTVRIAAQTLFALVGLGVALLWPMVRLSQTSPRRPLAAALGDFFVVAGPMQVVIWPMRWLTLWSWDVIAGVSLALSGWALLSAGAIAWGARTAGGAARTTWMIGIAAIACGGAAIAMLASSMGLESHQLWLASPLTVAQAITQAPSGLEPSMDRLEWRLALAPGCLGALLIAAGAVRAALPGAPDPRMASRPHRE